MSKIKTRESVKDIKVLDKAGVVSERMKTALVRSKDQASNLLDDGQVSPSEYAEDKVQYAAEDVADQIGHDVSSGTKRAVEKGKEAYRHHREDVRLRKAEERINNYDPDFHQTTASHQTAARRSTRQNTDSRAVNIRGRRNQTIKTAERAEHTIKQIAHSAGKKALKSSAKGSVKSAEKAVKTAEKTSKAAIKTAEASAKAASKAAQATAKAAQKAAEIARHTAIAAYKAAIAAAKATAAAVKAIIAGVKALIAAIAAGGWVAVIVIVIICLISLIVGSCFGIFFSNETSGSGQTMQQVVQEINLDYQNQIDSIKTSVTYDDLEMSGSRAVCPEVLSIYAVKTTTDPDDPQEVATMTDEKKQLLKDIFWEMNDISHRSETRTETVIIETDDGNGNILEEEVQETRTTLYITVSHKTAEEMASQYGFNSDQNKQLAELLADENSSMWLAVLYGVYGADDQIVMVALSQIGNVGGEPYWSWYGFGSRVEWCACFVSWCADQCGYIEMGVIPKYAGCAWGVEWFRNRGQWADNSIEPTPGMIIFFDWDDPDSGGQDGESDHTGIVEKVENGIVYTVEGNSGDSCRERTYSVGYYEILGYGIPAY